MENMICEICRKRRGGSADHTECSKKLKQMYNRRNKVKTRKASKNYEAYVMSYVKMREVNDD